MAEEEQQTLADLRRHADLVRHQLGIAFASSEADPAAGIPARDRDPEQDVRRYV